MQLYMVYRGLLRNTFEYSRKVNLAQRVMQSTRCFLPTLPIMSVGSLQQGVCTFAPVKSVKVMRRHVVSGRVSKKCRVSRKPKNMYSNVCYTPMAELRRNYETLLLQLKPVVPKVDSGGNRKSSIKDSPPLDLSIK